MPHIILDRDGVINYDSNEYIKSAEEWQAIPGSLEAIAQLNRVGFKVYIATNQSGLARGLFDLETLNEIHNKFHHELASVGGCIEAIVFCPHHPDQKCSCRKPKPGLLHKIANDFQVPLKQTYFIGDSLTDVEAAWTAGCLPILIESPKTRNTAVTVPRFSSLAKAADYVIEESRDRHSEILST